MTIPATTATPTTPAAAIPIIPAVLTPEEAAVVVVGDTIAEEVEEATEPLPAMVLFTVGTVCVTELVDVTTGVGAVDYSNF